MDMASIDRKSPVPYYRQVREILLNELRSGRIRSGQPIPDERSLSKKLRLSRMTVRKAIVGLADEGVFERVRGRGTFVKERSEWKPASGVFTAAIISKFDADEIRRGLFYYRLIQGIHEATADGSVSIVTRRAEKPYGAFADALRSERLTGGLIIMGVVHQPLLNELARAGIPAVLVDSSQPDSSPPLDCVGAETEDASRQAVKSLIDWGHRDIAHITFHCETPSAIARRTGWEKALREAGLVPSPKLLLRSPVSVEGGYAVMKKAIIDGFDATAVFCAADDIAVGVIAAATERGIHVPADISVVGVGDIGHFTSPPLSTVRMPVEDMGRKAVELLKTRLLAPETPVREILLPSEYIMRASTDCPARGDRRA